jgi:hypothetical protein
LAQEHSTGHTVEPTVINLSQARELRYWLHELRCSEEELRHAVSVAGPRAQVVRSCIDQVRHGGA